MDKRDSAEHFLQTTSAIAAIVLPELSESYRKLRNEIRHIL